VGIEGGEASKWKSLDGTVQELKLQEVNHRFRVGELAVLDAPGWIGPSKVGWMCIHGPLRVHVDSAVLSSFSSTFTLCIKHINMYSRVSDKARYGWISSRYCEGSFSGFGQQSRQV